MPGFLFKKKLSCLFQLVTAVDDPHEEPSVVKIIACPLSSSSTVLSVPNSSVQDIMIRLLDSCNYPLTPITAASFVSPRLFLERATRLSLKIEGVSCHFCDHRPSMASHSQNKGRNLSNHPLSLHSHVLQMFFLNWSYYSSSVKWQMSSSTGVIFPNVPSLTRPNLITPLTIAPNLGSPKSPYPIPAFIFLCNTFQHVSYNFLIQYVHHHFPIFNPFLE